MPRAGSHQRQGDRRFRENASDVATNHLLPRSFFWFGSQNAPLLARTGKASRVDGGAGPAAYDGSVAHILSIFRRFFMLRIRGVAVASCLLAVFVLGASAQETDLKDVLKKAIQAHGGEANLAKYKAASVKFKGKLEVAGQSLDITGEQSVLIPDKFRVAMAFQINGMNIDTVQIFDGKSLWVTVLGKTMELKDEALIKEIKESYAVERAAGLVGLLAKEYELSAIGDVKVKDKDAVGIRVSKKGQRDINLFFDKKSNLLIKTEYRSRLPMGGDQEVTQEKYFFDHKEVTGLMSPRRMVMEHDGKQILDIEMTDTQVLETLDPAIFNKPG